MKYSIAKVLSLFRKFGGIRLLWAYGKIGVIWTVIKTTLRGVITRKNAKEIYCSYERDVIVALQRKYHSLMDEKLSEYDAGNNDKIKGNIIWFCWLQGLECALPIVKACYNSLVKNITGKKSSLLMMLTERTIFNYLNILNVGKREGKYFLHCLLI